MASAPWSGNRRRYSALQPTPGRRLSALVPDAVVRRLSTLGLATRNSPSDCLIEQGKSLCAQYMRSRMNTAGKRWRWRNDGTPWAEARLVFPRLSCLGRHLERARPRLYAAIGRHAERALPSDVAELDPADLIYSIGVELFKEDITWGKVVSLMAVCGALANSAARSGRNEVMTTMLEAATASMQGPLLPWLQKKGGWLSLVEYCQPMERIPQKQFPIVAVLLVAAGFLFLLYVVIFIVKYYIFL